MKYRLAMDLRSPRVWIPALLIGAALAGGGSWFWRSRQTQLQTQKLDSLTVPVQRETLQVEISASGRIVPQRTVNLSPKVAGRLREVLVEQGDRVQRGQVLARMDAREIDTADEEALVRQAQEGVQDALARLSLARQKLTRQQLLQGQGAVSRQDLDLAQTEANQAEAALDSARARVNEAQSRLRTARVQLGDTEIRAPFSGIITQRFADPGAFVTPTTTASTTSSATSTSIVAIAQGLEVLANVPEVDIGRIRIGQAALVQADAYPDRRFQARVVRIAPEAVKEQNVTSFQVRLRLLDGLATLKSGMNVDLVFQGQRLPDALTVPTVAIVTREGKPGVLLPDAKGQPQFRPVTLGVSLGNRTQVLSGLGTGQRVFIDLPKGSDWEKQRR